jgi:hypothetical protein
MARRRVATPYRSRTFLSDALAWFALSLVLACGAFAWQRWAYRRVAVADPGAGARDPRLVVLAYDRVVDEIDARHVDSRLLRDQLLALRRTGFRPVSLDSVLRFYRGEGELPARALLVTFDHGYLSSFLAADPILRELGWPAVMFVMTERQERRDPFFLYWPALRRMAASGIWQIASHGRLGHVPITIDAEGTEGPFFVRRQWLASAERNETGAEFAARVMRDEQEANSVLQSELGRPVLAYAPPLKDVAIASLDPEVLAAHEQALQVFHPLAFVDDLFGVNDRSSDAHHLKRLRVSPRWSAQELLGRIEAGLGNSDADADDRGSYTWVAAAGKARRSGGEVDLAGTGRADLWRAGSQYASAWSLEADVKLASGQLWVVQKSTDLAEEWRWGGDAERTHLQRHKAGEQVQTLQSFDAGIEPGRFHRLRVLRRGAGIWVEWDGKPVSDRPMLLPPMPRGDVGLVVWGGGGAADLALRNLRFEPVAYRTLELPGEPSTDDVQEAIRQAPTVAALSPLWLTAGEGGLREQPLDRDLLSILVRRYGWELLPTLRLESAPAGDATTLQQAFERATNEGWAGLRIDVSALPATDRQAVQDWASSRAARSGHRLIVDAAQASSLSRVRAEPAPRRLLKAARS